MKTTTRLKQLINAPEILIMPGVHDALSARIAARTGAKAITAGGYAISGAALGEPDSSQLGASELADHYARMCDAVDIPLFADGDTGFGNVINVARTVRQFERAGVAGLFIEDQTFPKRCGHTQGKSVVEREEIAGKLKAALDTRNDPDFLIMGRTDALATHGIEEAIERAQLFAELGCDLVFIEAPESKDQMRRICAEISAPMLANMIEFGKSPFLPAEELQNLGFAVAVWPVSSILMSSRMLQVLYTSLLQTGTTADKMTEMIRFEDYLALVGLPQLRDWEQGMADQAKSLTVGS